MRYSGQGEEIPIVLAVEQATNPDVASFQQLFEQDYIALFGRAVEGMDIEITVWSVNATTLAQKVEPVQTLTGTSTTPPNGQRDIFDPALGTSVESAIVMRAGLASRGPGVRPRGYHRRRNHHYPALEPPGGVPVRRLY